MHHMRAKTNKTDKKFCERLEMDSSVSTTSYTEDIQAIKNRILELESRMLPPTKSSETVKIACDDLQKEKKYVEEHLKNISPNTFDANKALSIENVKLQEKNKELMKQIEDLTRQIEKKEHQDTADNDKLLAGNDSEVFMLMNQIALLSQQLQDEKAISNNLIAKLAQTNQDYEKLKEKIDSKEPKHTQQIKELKKSLLLSLSKLDKESTRNEKLKKEFQNYKEKTQKEHAEKVENLQKEIDNLKSQISKAKPEIEEEILPLTSSSDDEPDVEVDMSDTDESPAQIEKTDSSEKPEEEESTSEFLRQELEKIQKDNEELLKENEELTNENQELNMHIEQMIHEQMQKMDEDLNGLNNERQEFDIKLSTFDSLKQENAYLRHKLFELVDVKQPQFDPKPALDELAAIQKVCTLLQARVEELEETNQDFEKVQKDLDEAIEANKKLQERVKQLEKPPIDVRPLFEKLEELQRENNRLRKEKNEGEDEDELLAILDTECRALKIESKADRELKEANDKIRDLTHANQELSIRLAAFDDTPLADDAIEEVDGDNDNEEGKDDGIKEEQIEDDEEEELELTEPVDYWKSKCEELKERVKFLEERLEMSFNPEKDRQPLMQKFELLADDDGGLLDGEEDGFDGDDDFDDDGFGEEKDLMPTMHASNNEKEEVIVREDGDIFNHALKHLSKISHDERDGLKGGFAINNEEDNSDDNLEEEDFKDDFIEDDGDDNEPKEARKSDSDDEFGEEEEAKENQNVTFEDDFVEMTSNSKEGNTSEGKQSSTKFSTSSSDGEEEAENEFDEVGSARRELEELVAKYEQRGKRASKAARDAKLLIENTKLIEQIQKIQEELIAAGIDVPFEQK